ncbi:MAG: DUF6174 domain-containing protein [Longimicrobiales bacterium]
MMLRSAAAAALSAVLVLLGSACKDQGPDTEGFLDDIAQHRAIWESKRPSSYVYELERWCNCPKEEQGPVRVNVEGTLVVERRYPETGAVVASSLNSAFPAVDGLFDMLEDAARREPWSINVYWDAELGYPRDFYVDFESNVLYDELSYRVVTAPASATGS